MTRKKIPGLETPIHSVFCIGRNYINHAKEMGHTPPSRPIVFLKPVSSICFSGTEIELPRQSKNVHHEVELVLAIGKKGRNIPIEDALGYISGYGIGIDLTARDLQKEAKELGEPWSVAKGFDGFGPLGNFIRFDSDIFPDLKIELLINGTLKQSGLTSQMIFPPQELVSYLSNIFTLNPGDLIFTGTPEGVSAIKEGDSVSAHLNNTLSTLNISVKG